MVMTSFVSYGWFVRWLRGLTAMSFGAFLVAWLAKERRSVGISYPMISAAGATADRFPLADSGTNDSWVPNSPVRTVTQLG